jgi:hypothetical protein
MVAQVHSCELRCAAAHGTHFIWESITNFDCDDEIAHARSSMSAEQLAVGSFDCCALQQYIAVPCSSMFRIVTPYTHLALLHAAAWAK